MARNACRSHVTPVIFIALISGSSYVLLTLVYNFKKNFGVDLPQYDTENGGLMTAVSLGRLGNNMMEFAALVSLARTNKCRAVLSSRMTNYLKSCFSVTTGARTDAHVGRFVPWTNVYLDYLMQDDYRRLPCADGPIKLTGYPSDWRFFHDHEAEVRRQLRFSAASQSAARAFFRTLARNASVSVYSYIGIHVRRTDYPAYLERQSCQVADERYLKKAMRLMLAKYPNSVFVVASDDIVWCKSALSHFKPRAYFVDQSSSPCTTMAILAHCNHTVITQGTFGFWAAYLAGGQVIYYTDYCNNNTSILKKFQGMHLPNWMPISAASLH